MSDNSDRSNSHENGDKPSWRERVLAKLGLSRKKSLRTDLAEVLAEAPAQTAPEFSPAEQTMLQNVLALRERRVSDVMIARAEMVAVKQDIPIGQLLQTSRRPGIRGSWSTAKRWTSRPGWSTSAIWSPI